MLIVSPAAVLWNATGDLRVSEAKSRFYLEETHRNASHTSNRRGRINIPPHIGCRDIQQAEHIQPARRSGATFKMYFWAGELDPPPGRPVLGRLINRACNQTAQSGVCHSPASFQSSRKKRNETDRRTDKPLRGQECETRRGFSHVSTVENTFISLEIDEITGTGAVPLIRLEQLRWQELIKMHLVTSFTCVRSVWGVLLGSTNSFQHNLDLDSVWVVVPVDLLNMPWLLGWGGGSGEHGHHRCFTSCGGGGLWLRSRARSPPPFRFSVWICWVNLQIVSRLSPLLAPGGPLWAPSGPQHNTIFIIKYLKKSSTPDKQGCSTLLHMQAQPHAAAFGVVVPLQRIINQPWPGFNCPLSCRHIVLKACALWQHNGLRVGGPDSPRNKCQRRRSGGLSAALPQQAAPHASPGKSIPQLRHYCH